MDDDPEPKQKEIGDLEPYARNVFQPNGIRCNFQNDFEFDRFLLDYSFRFLPSCTIILWFIFLFFGN